MSTGHLSDYRQNATRPQAVLSLKCPLDIYPSFCQESVVHVIAPRHWSLRHPTLAPEVQGTPLESPFGAAPQISHSMPAFFSDTDLTYASLDYLVYSGNQNNRSVRKDAIMRVSGAACASAFLASSFLDTFQRLEKYQIAYIDENKKNSI